MKMLSMMPTVECGHCKGLRAARRVIEAALIAAAYLIGSLSFAVIVSRAYGLPDPHSYGSGNPGATNVLRTGRKTAAVLTLIGDAGKGYVAVLLARLVADRWTAGLEDAVLAAVALAAFLGHIWPVFFRFRGGKGVATAGGILFGIDPWLGLGTVATWLIIALLFRISSLAAVVAAVFAPLWYLWLFGASWTGAAVLAISVLLLVRHRDNIRRLISGEEGRIGRKPQGT
jgi:glycerol-3-phosphate acyltransferase PlsY